MSRRPSDFCHICLLAHAGSESFSVMQICYDLEVELSLGKCIHQLKLRKFCYVLNKRLCDGFIAKTIKESFRMKKCISFRAAGSPSQNVVEGLCLQSSSPTAKQSCNKRLEYINIKKHWNEDLYLVFRLKRFYVNFAIDGDRVTKTAVVNYVEYPQFFQIRISC